MTSVEEQTRGERAQRLLEDETLNQALDAIEAEVIAMWSECPMRDAEGKEALWQLYRTSKKFRAILTGYVQSGKLATENMARHEQKRGLRAVFGR